MKFYGWLMTWFCLLLTASMSAQADFIGLKIGATHWEPSLSGSFGTIGDPPIDTIDQFGTADLSESSLALTLEHPIPALPNIKYQGFDLESSGSRVHTGSLEFNGTTFGPGTVNSIFDLSHDDIVLYYELLDNWVNLDLGMDFKAFDGEVELTDGGAVTERVVIDSTLPLIYISARFDLPFSGFYIGADINSNFSIGSDSSEDSSIMLGYESENGLGVEGGIKRLSLELNDFDQINTDIEYDGVFFKRLHPLLTWENQLKLLRMPDSLNTIHIKKAS